MSSALAPNKPSNPSKYDNQILQQLERAQRRIQLLDLTASALVLVAGTVAYLCLITVLNQWLQPPVWGLHLALGLYVLGAGLYAALYIVRPLRWRINPYYAARKVEDTVAGAKNSLINWLDLHEEKLPPAIQASLGQRAAKDISQANIDQVESTRRASVSGIVAGILVFVLLVVFIQYDGGDLFRAFAFTSSSIQATTQLTVVKPVSGDTTVAIGEPVAIEVVVDAGNPASVRLLLRYSEEEGYQERVMDRDEPRKWSLLVPAYQVKNGFWYKVVGGDGSTPEYRVNVRAAAMIDADRLTVTYHYRDYLFRKVDRVQARERKVEDFKGTKVTLDVPTNRKIEKAWVEFQPAKGKPMNFHGQIDPNDPQRFSVSWDLDHDGHYSIHFVSKENERFKEVLSHLVIARADRAPIVEITQPGMDHELPVNGLLKLEGKAWDDVGVAALTLKMKVVDGPAIADRPYRTEAEIRLKDGGFPLVLVYKDAVQLPKLQGAAGARLELKEGMTLEYWLEASDNCDLQTPNKGESVHFRVKLVEADKDVEKQKQDIDQANRDVQQHHQDQDKNLQQQNDARQKEEQQRKKDNDKAKGGKSDNGNKPEDPKRTEQEKKEQEKKDKETKRKAEELQQQLNKETEKNEKDKKEKEQNQDNKGQAKADKQDQKPGQGKDDPGKKEEGNHGDNKDKQQGEGKGSPDKKEPPPNPTKQPKDNQPQEGQTGGKPEGMPMMEGTKPGADKPQPMEGMPMGDKPGEGKQGDAKQPPQKQPDHGDGKNGGEPMMGQPKPGEPEAGKEKDASAPMMGQEQGKGKEGEPMMGSKEQPAQAKGPPEKKEEKGTGKGDGKEQTAQTEPKKGAPPDTGDAGKEKGSEKDTATAKEDKTPPQSGQSGKQELDTKPGQKATKEDVQKAIEDLKSGDAKARDEARQKLEQAADNATDKDAREAAAKELEKQGRGDKERQPAATKAPPPDNKKPENADNQPCEKSKPGPGMNDAKPGDGKQGNAGPQGMEQPGQGKGPPQHQPGMNDPQGMGDKGQKAQGQPQPGEAKNQYGQYVPSQDPGKGGGGLPGNGDTPTQNTPTADKADPRHAQHAGNLQLKGLSEEQKKKVLKDAGFKNEAEYNEFMKAYQNLVEREGQTKKETPGTPGQALPTTGPREVKKADGGTNSAGGSLGQPPPEYRDPYEEFTRKIAEKQGKK